MDARLRQALWRTAQAQASRTARRSEVTKYIRQKAAKLGEPNLPYGEADAMARRALRAAAAAERLRSNPDAQAPARGRLAGCNDTEDVTANIRYTVYIDWLSPDDEHKRLPFYLDTPERLTAAEAVQAALQAAASTEFPQSASPPPPGFTLTGRGVDWQPIRGTLGSVACP